MLQKYAMITALKPNFTLKFSKFVILFINNNQNKNEKYFNPITSIWITSFL